MNETYNISAVVIARRPYRESDVLATLFSRQYGKMELVARGAKKMSSRLASHLEPFNISEIMVIKGKKFDYAGSISGVNCHFGVKSSLLKTVYAGKAISAVDKALSNGQRELAVFILLEEYLGLLDGLALYYKSIYDLLHHAFLLKLFSFLGYKPELNHCLACGNEILPACNFFDAVKGGLICASCFSPSNRTSGIRISPDCVKIIRYSLARDLRAVNRLKLDNRLIKEYANIIGTFTRSIP